MAFKFKFTAVSVISVAIVITIVINLFASINRNTLSVFESFDSSVAVPNSTITNARKEVTEVDIPLKTSASSIVNRVPLVSQYSKTIAKENAETILKTTDLQLRSESENFRFDVNENLKISANLHTCDREIDVQLSRPQLVGEALQWCRDALHPQKGQVIVGKSWGKLSKRTDRDKFEALNCNSVAAGKNPSCADAWGDAHVLNWRKSVHQNYSCPSSNSVRCHRNDLNDQYCVFTGAMIDFSRYRKESAGREVPKRIFNKDFLTIDCAGNAEVSNFNLEHLYSSKRPNGFKCDVHIPGTTVLYSHDNIRNLCHTWNDWLNVWLLLWLENLAEKPHSVNFLTVDSMKQYNDFDDLVNDFFSPYHVFKQILRGAEYRQRGQRVCFDSLITQSLPSRGFVWENWQQDIPCSFVGPSSLFQRWNLQLRKGYDILRPAQVKTSQRRQVLLIVRSESKNDWGSYRTSRLMSNTDDVIRALQSLSRGDAERKIPSFDLVVQDMGKVGSLEKQMRLIANTSIIVGMHGAGIVHSMHMSVGTEHCCGVLEIFPRGEFFPVRGYANMIRRMGIHYSRLDLSEQNSRPNGAVVPAQEVVSQLINLLHTMSAKPSCILKSVLDNPFLH